MGVEVKGAGDGVVIADRGCNDGCGCRDHSGWGSGWGAVGGALVGGGFGAAAVSVWDNILGLINNRSESPRNPAPDFEEFKLSMNERLTNQETLLLRIAQELGLDKPKQ